jgi:hypothetical protein
MNDHISQTGKMVAIPPLPAPTDSEPWQEMGTAPLNATWVEVRMKDGTVLRAHWASDLSGEEQPPFEGWFIDRGTYMLGIDDPYAWRPLPPNKNTC